MSVSFKQVLSGPKLLYDLDLGVYTAFIRHITYDEDGVPVSTTDTGLDGVTPYTVTGVVTAADGSAGGGGAVSGVPQKQGFVFIYGIGTWSRPATANEVTVIAAKAAAPDHPTESTLITDHTGSSFGIKEGVSLTWGNSIGPALSGTFTVEPRKSGSETFISWTEVA